MALYIPYIVGSVSFAYMSSSVLSYVYGEEEVLTPINNISYKSNISDKSNKYLDEPKKIEIEIQSEESNNIEKEDINIIEQMKDIEVQHKDNDLEIINKDISKNLCTLCNSHLPLKAFSKNQQKKLKSVWKCKLCLQKKNL